MQKKEFIESFLGEDKKLISSLYDKICLCLKTEQIVFSAEFLNPRVWRKIIEISQELGVRCCTKGIKEECEKKILGIYIYEEPTEFPVTFIKIHNKSKFKTLEHKDYLGALTSLGIRREKLSDIVVVENEAFLLAHNDIAHYILYSMEKVANCPCEVSAISENEVNLGENQLKTLNLISTSLRADCLVSSICNISRSKAEQLIGNGKVILNYEELKKKDKLIEVNDIVTIRSFGKFKFKEVVGDTQRGRLKIKIDKYL